jgi:hypothetical protein
MCTLNSKSLTNPLHCAVLVDLAKFHNIHVFALVESWPTPFSTNADIFYVIPHGSPS